MDFLTLGISKEMESVLRKNGITEPTPVQEQAIPTLLEGKDIIAQAQTGTGKTLAFLLPILEGVNINAPHVQALIVTPTRELAIQITAEVRKLLQGKGAAILAAYGGQDVEQQMKKLKGAVHIVIGTPGRLLDHLRRKTVDFKKLKMLVLDEADQMLHMGFLDEVEQIIRQTSGHRQTMLFSATIPKQVRALSSKYMRQPVHIRIQTGRITLDEIKQLVIETTEMSKQDALFKVIDECRPFMAVIFCRTKHRVSVLNEALQLKGYNSDELHGDLTQGKREKVMKAFRKTELQLLVATDVAARGLDIEGITHVFNYDIAKDAESYIHRIGRTGRAGQTGSAITFVTPTDKEALNIIEKGIEAKLDRRKIVKEGVEDQKHTEDSLVGRGHGSHSKPRSSGGVQGRRPVGRGRNPGAKGAEGRPSRTGKPPKTKPGRLQKSSGASSTGRSVKGSRPR